jgi:hypothetical protein
MEELLKGLKGKKIDVSCATTAVFRGDVIGLNDDVLQIRDEDGRDVFIAIDKISVVSECSEHATRPGFVV